MLTSNLPGLQFIHAEAHFYHLLQIRKNCWLDMSTSSGQMPFSVTSGSELDYIVK